MKEARRQRCARVVWAGSFCALLLFAGAPVHAEVGAIQRRAHGGTHELAVAAGYLPLDPFAKSLTGGLSYALQLGDVVSWRLLDLRYAQSYDTQLKEDLLWAGQATQDRFASPELLVHSSVLAELFYGRQSLLNRADLHMALYLLAGGGAVVFRSDADEREVRPALTLGGGLRFWLARWCSLRLEVQEQLTFAGWSLEQLLGLDLALAFHLGGRSR